MINVDKVFVTHYKPLKERKGNIENLMTFHNIEFDWVDGEPDRDYIANFYDNTPEGWRKRAENEMYSNPPSRKQMKESEISLLFKHVEVYKKIVKEKIQTTLVLEDDVLFIKNFSEQFNFNLRTTPSDWDFVYIGSGCNLRIDNNRLQQGQVAYIKEHPASKCTDSYLITYEAAKKILNSIERFAMPIDFELNYQMWLHDMNVYWWEPPVVAQGSQVGTYRSAIQNG